MAFIDPITGESIDTEIIPTKANAYEKELERRARAAQAGREAATVAGELPGLVKEAGVAGKSVMRQKAAQMMAGTMSQAGASPMGGGQNEMLNQMALNQGLAEGKFGTETALAGNSAMMQAALAKLQAAGAEQEIFGGAELQKKQEMARLRQEVENITAGNKGFFTSGGGKSGAEIRKLSAGVTDPELLAFINLEAAKAEKQTGGTVVDIV
jgi:hypothetical protein